MTGTVYLLTNSQNEKFYVGQTVRTLRQRWSAHVCDAKRGRKIAIIHRAIGKYGLEPWIVQTLGVVDNREDLDNLEKVWIILLQSRNPQIGYNLAVGGEGNSGIRHSLETRLKKSQQLLGNKHALGYHHTKETKQKLSLASKGKKKPHRSPEHCLAISKAKTGKPGRKLSAEEIQNISLLHTGKKLSEETKAKIGAATRARLTPEHIQKMNAARLAKRKNNV